jgi:hypothetical protein
VQKNLIKLSGGIQKVGQQMDEFYWSKIWQYNLKLMPIKFAQLNRIKGICGKMDNNVIKTVTVQHSISLSDMLLYN